MYIKKHIDVGIPWSNDVETKLNKSRDHRLNVGWPWRTYRDDSAEKDGKNDFQAEIETFVFTV